MLRRGWIDGSVVIQPGSLSPQRCRATKFEKFIVTNSLKFYYGHVNHIKQKLNPSRRRFLRKMSYGFTAATLGGNVEYLIQFESVKIARIEVFPIVSPMAGRFKFFEIPHGHMPDSCFRAVD